MKQGVRRSALRGKFEMLTRGQRLARQQMVVAQQHWQWESGSLPAESVRKSKVISIATPATPNSTPSWLAGANTCRIVGAELVVLGPDPAQPNARRRGLTDNP